MRQMHHFCLLDEMLVPREPENGLPLFTELPRREIPGNQASGLRDSRKLSRHKKGRGY
jgi:hypothetical protein